MSWQWRSKNYNSTRKRLQLWRMTFVLRNAVFLSDTLNSYKPKMKNTRQISHWCWRKIHRFASLRLKNMIYRMHMTTSGHNYYLAQYQVVVTDKNFLMCSSWEKKRMTWKTEVKLTADNIWLWAELQTATKQFQLFNSLTVEASQLKGKVLAADKS